MTDEAILGVIGIAVSAAQAVPLFSKATPRPARLVAVFTITVVLVGAALWYREQRAYRESVELTKSEVTAALSRPKTFDQLLEDLYYPAYGTLEDAIDEMVDVGQLKQQRLSAVSRSGDTVDVRVYGLPSAFDVRQSAKQRHQ